MHTASKTTFRLACGAIAFVILAAGCDTGPSLGSSSPRPSPNAIASQLAREAASPDPNFDFGYSIHVTEAGFHPHWLIANCCETITWVNKTNEPVSIVFDHQLVHSGLVPPGGTFSWTPTNVQSVAYHLDSSPQTNGVVQVNQTSD